MLLHAKFLLTTANFAQKKSPSRHTGNSKATRVDQLILPADFDNRLQTELFLFKSEQSKQGPEQSDIFFFSCSFPATNNRFVSLLRAAGRVAELAVVLKRARIASPSRAQTSDCKPATQTLINAPGKIKCFSLKSAQHSVDV